MTQQCGNCKWWDIKMEFINPFNNSAMSQCLNKNSDFLNVYKDINRNCSVYEERKECEELE